MRERERDLERDLSDLERDFFPDLEQDFWLDLERERHVLRECDRKRELEWLPKLLLQLRE